MIVSFFSRYIFYIYFIFLAIIGRTLRDFDLDYAAAILLSLLGLFSLPFLRVKLSVWDLMWLPASFMAIVYLVLYSLEVALPADPIIQSLMFFMPFVSLLSRNLDVEHVDLGRLFFGLAVLCFIGLLPYYSEVLVALTSSHERARFHSYFSILICFFMVSFLLSGWIEGKYKVIFSIFLIVIFSGAAAHRSMYLAFVCQVIFWMLVNGNVKALIRPLIAIVIGGGVLMFTDFGNVIIGKFSDSAAGTDGNTESRLYYYQQVFVNSYHDFLGVGFGEYFKYGLDSKGQPVAYALQHNSYLSYLYFLGWIPFLAVLVGLVRLVFYRGGGERLKVYLSIFIGMSFFSLLNVYLEQPTFGIVYWILYGLITREIQCARKIF